MTLDPTDVPVSPGVSPNPFDLDSLCLGQNFTEIAVSVRTSLK
jgi:hypothetical protein